MKFLRFLLGIAFGTAGVLHFTNERQFRNIVPDYLPLQKTAVLVTGVFEIFFGMMLLIQRLASWSKKGINLFLLAVFPANIYMARKKLPLGDKEVPKWALYLRLPLQFVLMGIVKKL
ncbi:DoxX family protein [Staphylococcus sp. FSL K6-0223]|uniref:DoxX family protein n=1 Tax=Staphylococcus sp. FSL K6-0223 TaxID=2921424 RepID=UPI0030FA3C8C